MFAVQILMIAIYPAHQMLFYAVTNTSFELPAILMLSVVKLVMKNLLASTVLHMEDIVPEEVIFNVDFFHAIYLVTCMQGASSPNTVIAIMAVDVADTIIELRELYQRTRSILNRFSPERGVKDCHYDLLVSIRSWIHQANLKKLRNGNFQTLSCISHRVSLDSRALLEKLQTVSLNSAVCSDGAVPVKVAGTVTVARAVCRASLWRCCPGGSTPVQPIKSILVPVKTRSSLQHQGSFHRRMQQNFNTLSEPLELLFTSECLVLTEYLETIIPIMYGCGILVMVNLPSAKYHSEMQGITLENVGGKVLGIFAYGLLELISFVALAVIMRRNCGIRALYQLAFVLETQMPLVQAKFVLWVIMVLACRVTHFGTQMIVMLANDEFLTYLFVAGVDFHLS
ncbi:hypothetical protein F442_01700 [Phytophthora nicotianae P10297]|uniref:Uncharacterized protein n=1 Tax=Phytophthora nicotianae P10297 TaxID=1317064 RepID=W3A2I7_PHYNI|nr:hypothetical protein F442_01700 [Phytophthora nicotianae P10297]